MSSGSNPFQTPPTDSYQPAAYYPPPKMLINTPLSDRLGMAWLESVSYIFANSSWLVTLLLCSLCYFFIPIVGPLVVIGYQFETVIDLTTSRGAGYRPFDFNRFVPYLKRGLWPFLVAAVCGLVLVPLFYLVMLVILVGAGAIGAAAGPDVGPVLAGACVFIGMLFFMAIAIGMNLILQPLLLRAALTQEFGQGFQFSFAMDFLARVRGEMFMSLVFQFFMGFAIMLLGLLACFFGIYPAVIVMLLMQAHIQFQLYELYRARGGEVIQITSAD